MPSETVTSTPRVGGVCDSPYAPVRRQDPLQRFTQTPYAADLPVMGRTVRLETNDLSVLEHAVELFTPYPGSPSQRPEFLWRIVCQSHPQMRPPWPRRSAFSDPNLRFAEFGQTNFLAVDIAACEAIAFISEGLAEDAAGFACFFLDTLFYMTAGALGLVSLSAACVALGTDALLVMGPPDQGKTTACYLAARSGLKFQADQAVFLEMKNGRLHAWGDFFPLAFRPQALQFMPELRAATLQFSYCDLDFHCLDRQKLDSAGTGTVIPICCVVLERQGAPAPRMVPLAQADFCQRLSKSFALKEEERFEAQRVDVMNALAQLPAYHLAYGSDPATAAPFFHDLLMAHKAKTGS
jgi:hypothetical protein